MQRHLQLTPVSIVSIIVVQGAQRWSAKSIWDQSCSPHSGCPNSWAGNLLAESPLGKVFVLEMYLNQGSTGSSSSPTLRECGFIRSGKVDKKMIPFGKHRSWTLPIHRCFLEQMMMVHIHVYQTVKTISKEPRLCPWSWWTLEPLRLF